MFICLSEFFSRRDRISIGVDSVAGTNIIKNRMPAWSDLCGFRPVCVVLSNAIILFCGMNASRMHNRLYNSESVHVDWLIKLRDGINIQDVSGRFTLQRNLKPFNSWIWIFRYLKKTQTNWTTLLWKNPDLYFTLWTFSALRTRWRWWFYLILIEAINNFLC